MWPKYIGNYIIEMFVAQVMNVGITFPTQNQAGIYVPTFNTKKMVVVQGFTIITRKFDYAAMNVGNGGIDN